MAVTVKYVDPGLGPKSGTRARRFAVWIPRDWYLYLPIKPLVLLHGSNTDCDSFAHLTRFPALLAPGDGSTVEIRPAERFIVIAPEAAADDTQSKKDASFGAPSANWAMYFTGTMQGDDVALVANLLAQLDSLLRSAYARILGGEFDPPTPTLDVTGIMAAGFSSGARMAGILARDLAVVAPGMHVLRVAAVCTQWQGFSRGKWNGEVLEADLDTRVDATEGMIAPLSVLMIHGRRDTELVPFGDTAGASPEDPVLAGGSLQLAGVFDTTSAPAADKADVVENAGLSPTAAEWIDRAYLAMIDLAAVFGEPRDLNVGFGCSVSVRAQLNVDEVTGWATLANTVISLSDFEVWKAGLRPAIAPGAFGDAWIVPEFGVYALVGYEWPHVWPQETNLVAGTLDATVFVGRFLRDPSARIALIEIPKTNTTSVSFDVDGLPI